MHKNKLFIASSIFFLGLIGNKAIAAAHTSTCAGHGSGPGHAAIHAAAHVAQSTVSLVAGAGLGASKPVAAPTAAGVRAKQLFSTLKRSNSFPCALSDKANSKTGKLTFTRKELSEFVHHAQVQTPAHPLVRYVISPIASYIVTPAVHHILFPAIASVVGTLIMQRLFGTNKNNSQAEDATHPAPPTSSHAHVHGPTCNHGQAEPRAPKPLDQRSLDAQLADVDEKTVEMLAKAANQRLQAIKEVAQKQEAEAKQAIYKTTKTFEALEAKDLTKAEVIAVQAKPQDDHEKLVLLDVKAKAAQNPPVNAEVYA